MELVSARKKKCPLCVAANGAQHKKNVANHSEPRKRSVTTHLETAQSFRCLSNQPKELQWVSFMSLQVTLQFSAEPQNVSQSQTSSTLNCLRTRTVHQKFRQKLQKHDRTTTSTVFKNIFAADLLSTFKDLVDGPVVAKKGNQDKSTQTRFYRDNEIYKRENKKTHF